MRSSKNITKNNAEKVMAKSRFGRRFHDLKNFEAFFFPFSFFSFIFLKFTINLRATVQKFVRKHQFNVMYLGHIVLNKKKQFRMEQESKALRFFS